jgi:pimeloyl-ACP methyl ester carboxylesterase
MPTANVRDIEMYYREHGNPEGEPLVMLHGFTATGNMFDPFLDELGQSYRLYVPDWRGHGRTTNPKGEIKHEDLAEDQVVFLQELGIKRAHFCGISSGGMQLTFIALRNPQLVQSLTYVASTYTFDERVKSLARKFADSASPSWKSDLKALHGPSHGEAYADEIIEHWVESIQRPNELPFSPVDLKRMAVPTLIIHGDRDSFFPVHIPVTMYQMIPKSELCILPDCGHDIGSARPQMFTTALLQFLNKHPLP